MSSGGYRETALDRAAAAGYAQQGAMAQRIWEDYGRPEADRWMRAKAQVGAFNPSILSFIQNPRPYQQRTGSLTLAAAPPPSRNTNTYRFRVNPSPSPAPPAAQAPPAAATPPPAPVGTPPPAGPTTPPPAPVGTPPPAGPTTPPGATTVSTVAPPGDQAPALVRWDDIKSTVNTWKLAGVPVQWETPGAMYQSMQDPAWLARYGADLRRQLDRNPQVRDFFAQNAPRNVLNYLGIDPQAAPPAVSVAPMDVDLAYWGFGQRLEAPNLEVVNPDWSALPRPLNPDNSLYLHSYLTTLSNVDTLAPSGGQSFNPLMPAGNLWATTPAEASVAPRTAQQWVDTPDASEAGRAFADALNAANLLRVNEAALAQKQDAAGALARRGVGRSAGGDSVDRAVELWANREAAKLQADTAAQRLQLEQALRNERNRQLQQRFENELAVMGMEQALREENDRRLIQKAQLGQQLTAAENDRLRQIWEDEMRRQQLRAELTAMENERNLQWASARGDLQQRAANDFYRMLEAQRTLAADRNQAALARAGWEAEQNQQRQNELMGLLNYLQADATGQLNPWQGVSAVGDYARGLADLAGQQAARAQAAQQGALGLWGSAFQALGSLYPWLRRSR